MKEIMPIKQTNKAKFSIFKRLIKSVKLPTKKAGCDINEKYLKQRKGYQYILLILKKTDNIKREG